MDIVKCFNRIPRQPVFDAAKHLGLDDSFVAAWADYLAHLNRRFRIQGILGEPSLSSCGFPEGCALSVVAMVIVGWAYALEAEEAMQSGTDEGNGSQDCPAATYVGVFADNFEASSTCPHSIARAEDTTLDFCRELDLSVALDKSWHWCTTKDDHVAQAGALTPRKHAERDLGADIAYSQRRATKTQQARCCKFTALCRQISQAPVPPRHRGTMCTVKGIPGLLYAAEVTGFSRSKMSTLRTKMASAIGGGKATFRAPELTIALLAGPRSDPEYMYIHHVLRNVRRTSEVNGTFRSLCDAVSLRYQDDVKPRQGPVMVILGVAERLGWKQIGPMAFERPEGGGSFCLWTIEQRLLDSIVEADLSKTLCRDLARRKHMAYAAEKPLDFHHLAGCIAKRPQEEQGMLIMIMAGGLRWATVQHTGGEGERTCPWCGEAVDSPDHIWSSCETFASVRQDHQQVLERWATLPKSLRCYGHVQLGNTERLAVAEGLRAHAGWARSCLRRWENIRSGPVVSAWSDGSAKPAELPRVRRAGWAAVHAPQGKGPQVLSSGQVTGGLHTVPRAELMAAVETVAELHHCAVAIDCAYVAYGLTRLPRLASVVKPNGDLWKLLAFAAHKNCSFSFRKVKAHGLLHHCRSEDEAVDCFMNSIADKAAKKAVVLADPNALERDHNVDGDTVNLVHDLQLAILKAIMSRSKPAAPRLPRAPLVSWGEHYSACVHVDLNKLPTLPHGRHPLAVGADFAALVAHWIEGLTWPAGETGGAVTDPGMTFLELAVCFELSSQTRLPRRCDEVVFGDGAGGWVVPSERDLAAQPATMERMAKAMAMIFKCMISSGALPRGFVQACQVPSLANCGYRARRGLCAGIRPRPHAARIAEASDLLQDALSSGPRRALLRRNLSVPLAPRPAGQRIGDPNGSQTG